jgi:hypothetical protein
MVSSELMPAPRGKQGRRLKMARYTVSPILDENCAALDSRVVIISTDDLAAAKSAAETTTAAWGAGIHDAVTDEIDVGFGFGVSCPEIDADIDL